MSEQRRYHIEVAGHPLSPNRAAAASLRERLRDKRVYRESVAWETKRLHSGPPLARARVTITLLHSGPQLLDDDNAVATVKHLVDGLCVAHGGTLLIDDSPAHITLLVRQKRGPRRAVLIDVEELEAQN